MPSVSYSSHEIPSVHDEPVAVSVELEGGKGEPIATMGEMFSHEGRIFCDQLDDLSWVVTDILTFEQHTLLGGPWEAEFHPTSGRAVLFDDADEALPLVVDQLMDRNLYIADDSAELYMVELRGDDLKRTPMHVLCSRFKEGLVNLHVGATSATLEFALSRCTSDSDLSSTRDKRQSGFTNPMQPGRISLSFTSELGILFEAQAQTRHTTVLSRDACQHLRCLRLLFCIALQGGALQFRD
jgi:hypothetical protein